MKKKFTMLLASLFLVMGTAWAQVYQKIPHTKWTVTALNEAGTQGNEGGIAFLKDEIPETFYHSDYSNSYSDGTSGKKKGQDGLQAFMVELPEVMPIDKITYKGRSNGPNNWATKARIYVFQTLPDGWPKDGEAVKQLNAMTYTEKQDLLKRDGNTVLGTPAFDNNENGTWAADQNIKTAEFSSTQQGKYILFVADATTANNGYLCCGDFHLWQKLEGIVEDKPYFLKINGLDSYYLDTRVGEGSDYGNTISKTQTPVATYFTLSDGYWHISSLPGNERNFVGITNWDAIPGKDTPANWTLHKVDVEHSLWSLAQSTYYGDGGASKHFLGANNGDISGQTKLYTDKSLDQAVKFELVGLDEKQTAVEAARVALSHIGVGYPAADSEARTTLQAAIDAAEATAESINAAIEAYQANTQTVQMPEVGKVYRLVSGLFKTKKAIYSNNTELRWQNRDVNAMNQLWTVLSISGNNITLINVNDGLYPQKSNWDNPVMMTVAKNECSLEFLGKGQFQIKANKLQGMHANNHGGGTGTSGNIINYNTGADGASAWHFEEVSVTKAILAKQIASITNSYTTNSLLIKQEGLNDLKTAVAEAQSVHDSDGNFADALTSLATAMNGAAIDCIDFGYFYLKSRGAQKYAYNDNTSLKVADSKSLKSVFKLSKVKNGTFYVQNGNGYYPQNVRQSSLVSTAAAELEYTITRLESGYYALRPTNSIDGYHFWHDANNGTGNIVGWSNDADNTQWTFEALTVEEAEKIYAVSDLNVVSADVYVTYNGEGYTGDKDVKQAGGFYVLDNAPTTADFTVNNIGGGMIASVVVDGNSLSVNEGYDGSNIYILKCLKDNSYARYHEGCRLNAEDATNMLTYENNNFHFESLFYIEEGTGDYEDYYTIRSVAAPTMYAYNLNTANENSKVAMMEAPAEGGLTDAYYWKISSFGKDAGNITPKGGDAFGWNKRGSHNGMNHIGYWQGGNGTDDNKWFVRLVEEDLVPSLHSVVGYPTEESYEEYRPYAQIISRAGIEKLKNANWDMVLPEPGKYYRIKNDNGTGYLSSGTGTGKTQFVAGIGEEGTSIFFYDENKKLCSYTTGLYLANNGGFVNYTETVGQAAGTDFTFAKSTEWGKLAIWFNNSSRSFYSNNAGESNAGSGKQTGQYYRFTVEEVDMSFVRVEFNELAKIAREYAHAMAQDRLTHEDYNDAEVLSSKIDEIYTSVNANSTIAEIKVQALLLEDIIAKFNIKQVVPGFYYFVNYENEPWGEYLSDDRKSDSETQRLLTKEDPSAKNIFYYDGQALMSYASGFGFEYGICNTRTPEKMNHFEFGMHYELGLYTVISSLGTSDKQQDYTEGYWKNNNGELQRVDAANASGWDIQAVASLPVTIGSVRHATFYAPVAVKIPTGVKAYTGAVNGEVLTLTEVESVIPANTPVILIGDAKTYEFEIVESKAVAIESDLKGNAATLVNRKKDAEDKFYTLQNHDFDGDGTNDGIAFKKYTGDNLNGFRAYVELPEGTEATALRIRFADEEGATSIESVETDEELVIFDLAGRRVQKMEKGIYIVNGEKVVVK